jgi:hypothetical protein
MKLPLAGYHAMVVTLGCMAKGKGVSSRAILLISVKVLVGNAITTSHHARGVSPDYLLNKKNNKNERKKRIRIKGKNGLGKIASRTSTIRLLQRHP